jgi:hypothetical protein
LRKIVENLRLVAFGATDLNGLDDVTISAPANAQVLTYNSTSLQWENQTPAAGGGGDMLKATYDVDNDGVVDSAETIQIIVRNSTGVTLTKGQVVYLSGATGNRPNAVLSQAHTEATSSKTIGIVVANIANNSDGYVATNGTLHDLDTSAFTAGDAVWLSATTAGAFTSTVPAEPNHTVFIGYVARAHPTQGRLVISIQNGYEFDELHGVLLTSEANNDLVVYETSSALWKNKSISTIFGGTPLVTVPTLAQVTTAGNTTTNFITVGGITANQSVTASGAIARGSYFNQTLVAAANNDVLVGLDINPTFTNGAFTGVTTQDVRIGGTGVVNFQSANGIIRFSGSNWMTVNGTDSRFYLQPTTGAQFRWFTGGSTEIARLYSTGNLVLQNGGTFTDAGYRLDVQGTARVSGVLTLGSTITNGTYTYTLPGATGTLALTSAIPANPVGGTGSTNYIPKFTAASTIGNSNISDSGTLVNIGSDTNISGFISGGSTKVLPAGNTFLGQTFNVAGSANGWGIVSRNTWNFNDDAFTTAGFSAFDNRIITTRSIATTNGFNINQGYVINNGTATENTTVWRALTAGTGNFNSVVLYAGGATGPIANTNSYTNYIVFESAHIPSNNITNFYGLNIADVSASTITRAVNLQISSGTGKYNIYAGGTANNYLNGALGIGTTSLTGYNLRVQKNITGATTSYGIANEGTIQSDVTSQALYHQVVSATAAASFTLNNLVYYSTSQGTFGAGSTVSTQTGFQVNSNLIGATTNYGFKGQIPAGTNRWNLYMDGTAQNYLNGSLSIGTTTTTAKFQVTGSITAASAIARGTYLNNTLVAAANNDVLVGLDIAPTFTNGAFTGVTNYAIRLGANSPTIKGSTDIQLYYGTGKIKIGSELGDYTGGGKIEFSSASNATDLIINYTKRGAARWANTITSTSYDITSESTKYFSIFRTTGNLTLQNGGTFTDAGYRLDVNGTARVQGAVTATLANAFTDSVVYYNSSTGLMTYGTAPIAIQFKIDYDPNIIGVKNGSNVVFTTSATFISTTTRVYLNGQRLTRGVGYDYIETGTNQITFAAAPFATDQLIIEYQI